MVDLNHLEQRLQLYHSVCGYTNPRPKAISPSWSTATGAVFVICLHTESNVVHDKQLMTSCDTVPRLTVYFRFAELLPLKQNKFR